MAAESNNLAAPPGSSAANNLIWIDMEMTGLQPDSDRIIELAMVITDPQLTVLAESPVWALHQPDEVLDAMDAWNKSTHGRSGLIERVRASRLTEAEVEGMALAFLAGHVPPSMSPMCGNSICQDRRFLARWMPRLEQHFHYRNLDVSTLKEIVRRWKPEVAKGFSKEGKHQAQADIYDSLEELRYYRKTVFSI